MFKFCIFLCFFIAELSFASLSCKDFLKNTSLTQNPILEGVLTNQRQSLSYEVIAHKFYNGEYYNLSIDDFKTYEMRSVKSNFARRRDLEGNMNRGLYSLNYRGKSYFAKMFVRPNRFTPEKRIYRTAANDLVEADFIRELQNLVLLSDLGWGAKFIGPVIFKGHLVGVITEEVPGKLQRLRDQPKDSIMFARFRALKQLGLAPSDFQFIYDNLSDQFWIIDALWPARQDLNRLSSPEEVLQIILGAQ